MRLLALAVALLVPACLTSEIEGVGGESGTRAGSDDVPEETPVPRVTGSFDKPMLATELAKTELLTLTLTSEAGFAGDVTLAAQLLDSAGVPAPTDVQLTVPMNPRLTLVDGGTATAAFEIKVPMTALGANFAGNLKVDLMSASGTTSVLSPVTIEAIYTVDYIAGTGYLADKHANINMPELTVKRGAVLRFKNSDVIDHVIKADGAFSNYHENTVSGGAAGRTYDIPTSAIPAGSTGTLGCFNHTGTSSTYRVE